MAWRVFLASAALAFVAAGNVGGAGAAWSTSLSAREFAFAPKTLDAPVGEVTFVVKNEGAIEHNFVVETQAKKKVAEIAILEPGQTAEVSAALTPGAYVFYCSLPGHRDAGMEGSATVR